MIHAQLKYNLTLIMLMVVGLDRKSYSVSNRVILDKSSFRKKALTRKKKEKKDTLFVLQSVTTNYPF